MIFDGHTIAFDKGKLRGGIFMRMDDSEFIDWYNSASQEEKRLYERLYEFEEHFADMLFEEGSSVNNLIKCQSKQGNNGWQDEVVSLPDSFTCFSYNFFKLKVESLKGCGGYFSEKEQILCISHENLDSDSVLLHEMIHLHEFVVNEEPLFYHDTLLWALYMDLRDKISDLDKIISGQAHLLTGQSIYATGGLHDILFLLKSLDLDIRMGYPLGTVFCYGEKERLKDFTYRS